MEFVKALLHTLNIFFGWVSLGVMEAILESYLRIFHYFLLII